MCIFSTIVDTVLSLAFDFMAEIDSLLHTPLFVYFNCKNQLLGDLWIFLRRFWSLNVKFSNYLLHKLRYWTREIAKTVKSTSDSKIVIKFNPK